MLTQSQRIQTELSNIKKQLTHLPKGNIFCVKDQSRYKWFKSAKPKPQYLKKTNLPLIEQLAIRKYLSSRYEDLLHEKTAIDFYLRHHHADYEKSDSLLTHPAYQKILTPYFKPISQELSEWANAPYEKLESHPEQLIHKTSSGIMVRSKSETIIDMFLHTNRIPFRYECALHLDNIILHPDFTIRHPQTGEIYYWEHFGMMDKEDYRNNYLAKLHHYLSHNILPSIQLITTFETLEHPLSIETVRKIVEDYFL